MQSYILVTAANAEYFELVQETVSSIRDKDEGKQATIGFFDLGCQPEQLQWLESHVDVIRTPDWEFDFPNRDQTPAYLKGLLARPFLPRYFPGFDTYLWMDSDAWVQDWRAIDLFVEGAARRGLAITPEVDRGSRIQYGGLPKYWQWAFNHYYTLFSGEEAERYQSYPMLNAGVFALASDAPHWQLWASYLNRGLQQSASIFTDQFALNLAVYAGALDKTELLPAWCNWTCHFGLPAWDEERKRLVEPYLPHAPIGILHLTGVKADRVELATTKQGRATVRLRYTRTP
jgi:hypothetical protein